MPGGQTHPYGLSYLHYKLEPAVVDRIALAVAPQDEGAAESYILMRGARRTLSLLNRRHDSARGEFLWLGDPAGCGKTHFLNYYLTSRRRLAQPSPPGGRELILALDCSAPDAPVQLDHDILAALAAALGRGHGSAAQWLRMGAQAAFEAALDEARRARFRAIIVAIDLGRNLKPAFATDLVQIARASKRPSLAVVAAGLGAPPREAVMAEVGPPDLAKRLALAVGRARRLEPRWTEREYLYRGLEIAPFAPEEIFPFHPQTLLVLSGLQERSTIAGLAPMARELLSHHNDLERLICPYDLFEPSLIRHIIEERLGVDGRAALRNAASACLAVARQNRPLAVQILRTLVVAHLSGQPSALNANQLWNRIPVPPWVNPSGDSPEARRRVLFELAARSGGTIRIGASGVAFVRSRESAPDVKEFNDALPMLKLFDPELLEVGETSEIAAAIARMGEVLPRLAEEARGVDDTLSRFARACHSHLPPEVKRTISAFVALTEKSPQALLEIGARGKRFADAQAVVAAYKDLTAAAASVPGLLAMKDYLKRTQLEPQALDSRSYGHFRRLAAERRLLKAELGARAPYSAARSAIQTRFERFRWTYIELYHGTQK
jgi:hypothetical protein